MSSEDLRVPTFITYEPGTPASDKKLMKRKRPTKENKPNKKKKAVKAARKSKDGFCLIAKKKRISS
jgi:hypothetical protein